MAGIHDLSAVEQGAGIRAGELSPVDVTDHCLRRIERLSPAAPGAFVTVTGLPDGEAADQQLGKEIADLSR